MGNHANTINLRSCLCEAVIQECFQKTEAVVKMS